MYYEHMFVLFLLRDSRAVVPPEVILAPPERRPRARRTGSFGER